MRGYHNDYPPEYDAPEICPVCLKDPSGDCECPECPDCGEAGNLDCYRLHALAKSHPETFDMIRDLPSLANAVGADVDPMDGKHTIERIARRLYKDTSCGISFWTGFPEVWPLRIVLTGYCEGSDRECQPYELVAPFTVAELEKAIADADNDGCETWNETHGCPTCWRGECPECHGTGEVEADPSDPGCRSACKSCEASYEDCTKEFGEKDVDPDCKACGGGGMIL